MDTKPVNGPAVPSQIQPASAERAAGAGKSGAAPKAGSEDAAAASGGAKSWDVQLSPHAREILEARKKALDIARATDPVRADRVAELKAKIQSGEYKPDAGKIADGMMTEAIRDHLAMNPE